MNIRQKISGRIENGVFEPKNPKVFEQKCRELEGKDAVMVLQEHKPFKMVTVKQHGYFHKVICGILADFLGYTPEEVKAILKFKFKIKSVARLSTIQANDFYRQCREWAGMEFRCYIPLPGEFDWNEPEDPALLI